MRRTYGAITLILGAMIALFTFLGIRSGGMSGPVLRVLCVLAFVVICITGGNVVRNVQGMDDSMFAVSVGWGVWVVMLASVVGVVTTMMMPRTS